MTANVTQRVFPQIFCQTFTSAFQTYLKVFFVSTGAVLASSFWLVHWTNLSWIDQQDVHNAYVYIGLAGGSLLSALARSWLFFQALIDCSCKLHAAMLTSVLKAPVRFFDVNPAGRILNRFAMDIGYMDEVLPYKLLETLQYVMFNVGILVLVSVANVWVIGASVPFTVLSLYLSKRYIRAAREIKRIEAITCSLVCTHMTDTIHGITTIRVYKRQQEFIERFYRFDIHVSLLVLINSPVLSSLARL